MARANATLTDDGWLVEEIRSGPLGWAPASTCIVFGTSLEEYVWWYNTPTGITYANGLATVTKSTHGVAGGQPLRFRGVVPDGLNGDTTATFVDANTFTFPCPESLGSGTATVSSAVYYDPRRLAEYGWFNHLNGLLGGRLRLVFNAGKGGDTSSGMANRLSTDVLTKNAEWVFVGAPVNDVSTLTAAESVAAMQAIYARLLAAGFRVVALTGTPLGSGHANYSVANQNKLIEIAHAIRAYCLATPGMVCLDSFAAVVDPTSATAQCRSGYQHTDNIHFSPMGCDAIGQVGAALLAPLIPSQNTLICSAADNYGTSSANTNILDGGMFQGTGGTATSGSGSVSGTIATGWEVANEIGGATVVCTTAARTVADDGDTIGNNQVATITFAAANNMVSIKSSDVKARLAVGETYYAEAAVEISGISNLKQLYFAILYVATGGRTVYARVFESNTQTQPTRDRKYVLRTADFVIPDPTLVTAGSTISSVKVYLVAQASAAGAAVLKMGRAQMRKVA